MMDFATRFWNKVDQSGGPSSCWGCVNPAHLFLGSHKDNTQDAIGKGRNSHGAAHAAIQRRSVQRGDDHWSRRHPELVGRGERNGAKLTTAGIVEIRRMRADGARLREIAAAFGISEGTACNIVNRKTWRHVL